MRGHEAYPPDSGRRIRPFCHARRDGLAKVPARVGNPLLASSIQPSPRRIAQFIQRAVQGNQILIHAVTTHLSAQCCPMLRGSELLRRDCTSARQHSTGDSRRYGGITKTGNICARMVLIEAT